MAKIRAVSRSLIKSFFRFYQLVISPVFPQSCRYYPSCSNYAIEAIEIHGPIRGLKLTTLRLLRCHPFSSAKVDPVPLKDK